MAVTKLSNSGIKTGVLKYDSMLAGNSAYVPPSFDSISTVNLTGTAASVDITGIPNTYTHLQLRIQARSDAAQTEDYMFLRVNNINGYTNHLIYAQNNVVYPDGSTGNTYTQIYGGVTGASATSNIFGNTVIDIQNYTSTSKLKVIRYKVATDRNGAGLVALGSALATGLNLTAITSIDVRPQSGNFIAGSTFALYGIKG